MFRSASRSVLRGTPVTHQLRLAQTRRWVSDVSSPQKSRGWKSTAVRWGLAIGAVYYYNTSSIFAEEPPLAFQSTASQANTAPLPTIESITANKKPKVQASSSRPSQPKAETEKPSSEASSVAALAETEAAPTEAQSLQLSPAELEQEAGQEGAFNPETGEINWDCPCLGGMAHGPCGEDFKAAFSCFVYSKEDPKGIDCIDNFKAMQDCFRQHPEIYGAELDDEEIDAQLDDHIASEKAAEQQSTNDASAPVSPSTEISTPETSHVKEKVHEAISKEINEFDK
ncbi:Oxidoreductase [Myotisia sp. PD_48]|nr:Oxidoreductase [Myotisia sp. PD_48]